MREIPLKIFALPAHRPANIAEADWAQARPITTLGTLSAAITFPGERGISSEDQKIIRRLESEFEAMQTAGGWTLRLEEADYAFLVGKLRSMRWAGYAPAIAEIIDDVESAPMRALNAAA